MNMSATQAVLTVLLTCSVWGAGAGAASGAIEAQSSAEVPILYKHIGLSKGVPYRILYAVALAESGKTVDGVFTAWPWTLNFAGSAARYSTQDDALAALLKAISEGQRNIDIGPGQINLRWNGHLVKDWHELLDMRTNVEAAATVLRRELDVCFTQGIKSWWCAVGRYHSPGTSKNQRARAELYVARARRIHENLS